MATLEARNLKSGAVWKASGGRFDITSSHSGNGTVSAYAQNGYIVCGFTALGSGEYVTINTPFDMTIIDAHLVVGNGENVGSKTLTIKNTTTAVSSAMSMATDVGVARTTTWDEDAATFDAGDDDLRMYSSSHADGGATVYIKYFKI
tara:strand:- start:215 stop:655 length:441 start_codon:yes stop_codon:yes gene_type:complete